MQLTDRRIYFTWEDARRRQDIPLFEDVENIQELPRPITPTLDLEFVVTLWMARRGGYSFTKSVPLGAEFVFVLSQVPVEKDSVGCIDFTLMPEGYASEI